MAQLKGMQGNEIADDFNIKTVPTGRWGYTWDVFKNNFWRLVLLNILTLLTFAPAIVVIIFRFGYLITLGSQYPFNASVGYPFYPHEIMSGLAERVTFSVDSLSYAMLIFSGFIAAIGISGSAYSIRRLLQNGEFSMKGFFHGVKVGYFNTLLPVMLFLLFFYSTILVGDWMHVVGATGGNYAAAVTAYVFIIIGIVLFGLYLGWMFSVGVSYRVKFKDLLRNSFVLLIGTPIQTVFMAGFSLIPVWLLMLFVSWSTSGNMLLGLLAMIGFIFLFLVGVSVILISWLSYSQYVFDMYITPAIKAEAQKANAKKSPKELAEEKAEADRRTALELLAAGKSELIARPIMPISQDAAITSVGQTFTRASISNAAQQRKTLGAAIAQYEAEHANDPVYVEYNKMFAEREKAVSEPENKKGKKGKKKISAENLLR